MGKGRRDQHIYMYIISLTIIEKLRARHTHGSPGFAVNDTRVEADDLDFRGRHVMGEILEDQSAGGFGEHVCRVCLHALVCQGVDCGG